MKKKEKDTNDIYKKYFDKIKESLQNLIQINIELVKCVEKSNIIMAELVLAIAKLNNKLIEDNKNE